MRVHATRRTVLVATAVALAGCTGDGGGQATTTEGGTETDTTTEGTAGGDGTTAAENPAVGDVSQRGDLQLTSSAFEDGASIPEQYGREAENVNPPLAIGSVPGEAASLVLVMDDPDAVEPAGKVWLHWLVWNIPPSTTDIPEGWEPTDAVVGTNDFGNRGYGGPAPPSGTHRYRFKLYALDTTLDLPDSADKEAVGEAMAGHVLAQTQLVGTYPP